MPVNTAALKTFAPAMRRQILEAVGRKLDLLLHSQTPDTLSTFAKEIAELREQEAENREQLLERVAYTWFNRLCALRFLDAKGWHTFGCKVLMPAGEAETQPELLKLTRAGSLPAELKPLTNEARLHGLLDGQIPPAIAGADPQGEVYRELVLASCRSYHQLLPELFEGLDDVSELLLPDDLLSEGSIAGGFRSSISEEDCEDVEIIGWLYQFYISEKKEKVIGKVVNSEDIPAATQLFTPNWIVKYMVQNSLGATWLATYPDSPLKGAMQFYIKPAEQTPAVQAQLAEITPENLDPEALTLIDPACGSGHILVEAYVLLKAIYLERGYRQRDIPELILTKNLYGLDICPRAAQLAAFSLLMKGREDDKRLLERGIRLNVMALQNSTGLNVERLAASLDLPTAGVSRADVRMLVDLFAYAKTFGSLIQVSAALAAKLPAMNRLAKQAQNDLLVAGDLQQLRSIVRQAEILARQYDAAVANPPYMGSKYYCAALKGLVTGNFKEGKADLYGTFTLRNVQLVKPHGRIGMITIPNWMFLSSFSQMRKRLFTSAKIDSLVHNGRGVWGSDFGSCTFILQNSVMPAYRGVFLRLFKKDGSVASNEELQARFFNAHPHHACSKDFEKLPGEVVAYWISDAERKSFAISRRFEAVAEARQGLQTSDDNRFLRLWHEIGADRLGLRFLDSASALKSGRRWFPFNKGGAYRRWYGNNEYVVDWDGDGRDIKAFSPRSVIRNEDTYFLPGVTWTCISISSPSFRLFDPGFIIGHKGPGVFSGDSVLAILSLLNSIVVSRFLSILSPAVGFEVGQIRDLPYNEPKPQVSENAQELVAIARADWDNFETSWDFRDQPLLRQGLKGKALEASWRNWEAQSNASIRRMQELETENNRLFIAAYGLDGELQPEVPEEQITLARADQRKDIAAFLSYATGCMMGRYSLDQPGLLLADSRDSQAAQLAAYASKVGKPLSEVQFKPDTDAIIPVLDGEWFEDDIVARTREFLAVTFPESSVAENLRFIEDSLSKDIRKYFCTEFYKDHLQTYKKRPIYWLVQSPKKGFACLIYLHRYTKDTLNQVLNNYFRPYLQKLEARLAQLGLDQLNDSLPTRERTAARKEAEKITKVLKECQAWEQDALLPLAQQRIELDLDEGVKANYLKLQEVLAPIPGLAAKED